MYLKQLKITNYKSFLETSQFSFEPGFNVLTGANSSGKSSVLEAIFFHALPNLPHRSLLNVVEPDTPLAAKPIVEVGFSMSRNELEKLLFPQSTYTVGVCDVGGQPPHISHNDLIEKIEIENLLTEFSNEPTAQQLGRIRFFDWPSNWRSLGSGSTNVVSLQVNSRGIPSGIGDHSAGPSDIAALWASLSLKIHRFSSERAIQPTCGNASNELEQNCANLAFCISQLQNKDHVLADRLMGYLRRIFPTIYRVGAPMNSNGVFELKVQMTSPQLNRSDLAIPINQVGTGIGHALAMIYVALAAPTTRIILLEEPNSFLHPRALRELLAILSEIGGKHQFFITTHSSDVLRTINASTVTLLEYDGQQTKKQQTTGDKLHGLQAGLVDLGISLTDLHGCDKVLWVEGETEAAIFPLLLRHLFPSLAQGIAVLPLHATGDFESRKFAPKKVVEIYRRLSQDSFLAPPMVAITLDREKKSQSEIDQVEKDCEGVVHFLPKTMLEDYLLDADAIAFVLNRPELTSAEVKRALAEAEASEACLLQPLNKTSKTLHAAKVLKFVFDRLLKVGYHKTSHGPKIAEWLIANKSEAFDELRDWFGKFLNVQK